MLIWECASGNMLLALAMIHEKREYSILLNKLTITILMVSTLRPGFRSWDLWMILS